MVVMLEGLLGGSPPDNPVSEKPIGLIEMYHKQTKRWGLSAA